MKSLKHLMPKFSYHQKTVKELRKIVNKLSKKFIKITRNF